jgi:hypothetical protein
LLSSVLLSLLCTLYYFYLFRPQFKKDTQSVTTGTTSRGTTPKARSSTAGSTITAGSLEGSRNSREGGDRRSSAGGGNAHGNSSTASRGSHLRKSTGQLNEVQSGRRTPSATSMSHEGRLTAGIATDVAQEVGIVPSSTSAEAEGAPGVPHALSGIAERGASSSSFDGSAVTFDDGEDERLSAVTPSTDGPPHSQLAQAQDEDLDVRGDSSEGAAADRQQLSKTNAGAKSTSSITSSSSASKKLSGAGGASSKSKTPKSSKSPKTPVGGSRANSSLKSAGRSSAKLPALESPGKNSASVAASGPGSPGKSPKKSAPASPARANKAAAAAVATTAGSSSSSSAAGSAPSLSSPTKSGPKSPPPKSSSDAAAAGDADGAGYEDDFEGEAVFGVPGAGTGTGTGTGTNSQGARASNVGEGDEYADDEDFEANEGDDVVGELNSNKSNSSIGSIGSTNSRHRDGTMQSPVNTAGTGAGAGAAGGYEPDFDYEYIEVKEATFAEEEDEQEVRENEDREEQEGRLKRDITITDDLEMEEFVAEQRRLASERNSQSNSAIASTVATAREDEDPAAVDAGGGKYAADAVEEVDDMEPHMSAGGGVVEVVEAGDVVMSRGSSVHDDDAVCTARSVTLSAPAAVDAAVDADPSAAAAAAVGSAADVADPSAPAAADAADVADPSAPAADASVDDSPAGDTTAAVSPVKPVEEAPADSVLVPATADAPIEESIERPAVVVSNNNSVSVTADVAEVHPQAATVPDVASPFADTAEEREGIASDSDTATVQAVPTEENGAAQAQGGVVSDSVPSGGVVSSVTEKVTGQEQGQEELTESNNTLSIDTNNHAAAATTSFSSSSGKNNNNNKEYYKALAEAVSPEQPPPLSPSLATAAAIEEEIDPTVVVVSNGNPGSPDAGVGAAAAALNNNYVDSPIKYDKIDEEIK